MNYTNCEIEDILPSKGKSLSFEIFGHYLYGPYLEQYTVTLNDLKYNKKVFVFKNIGVVGYNFTHKFSYCDHEECTVCANYKNINLKDYKDNDQILDYKLCSNKEEIYVRTIEDKIN